jgi:predicted metalloprotease with PDZ domain
MNASTRAFGRVVIAVALLGVALTLAAAASEGVGAASPLLKVLIAPSAMRQSIGRGSVEVTIQVPGMSVAARVPVMSLAVMVPGQAGPQPVSDVSLSDAQGSVPLSSRMHDKQQWIADRAVKGDVVIHYRLPLQNMTPLSGGPPINLRIDGDGFSGVGEALIMRPNVSRSYRVAIDWDLSAMGPGAEGVSSFGDGNVRLEAGPVKRLGDTVFMAGHLQREPRKPAGAFSAVWLGDPGFDPHPAMRWTSQLHAFMSEFFHEKTEPPYRVFLRYNPMNAGGGAALYHSFIATYGTGVNGENLKEILGHEMTHTFTANELGNWYNEGTAVFYEALLPWRAHLFTTDDYLRDVNLTASRYYTNKLRSTPEDQVQPHFWEDTRIRVLPYDRGAMYFAVLNGKIRRASAGTHSIDDLIRDMNDRMRAAQPITEAAWLDLLRRSLGPEGVRIHRSMMSGGLMLPESDDFGPCFRRVVRQIRQFELGFDPQSLVGPTKIIKGLMPDSEAAKAGLRDGDSVTYAVALDAVQAEVNRTLTFHVTRDGKTYPMTYLPRGKPVDAYQWERIANVPDSSCQR